MAVKFAGTMNAINRGLETTKPAKGADMIEDWETALAEVEISGAKGILRDLGALRKQLEKDEPDSDRVHSLLHRLGAATTKIADKADKSQDKIRALGEALTEAGEDAPDEEEDVEAAANPKRGRKNPKVERGLCSALFIGLSQTKEATKMTDGPENEEPGFEHDVNERQVGQNNSAEDTLEEKPAETEQADEMEEAQDEAAEERKEGGYQ